MKHRTTLLLWGAAFFVLLTSMKTPVPATGSADLKVEIIPMENLRVSLKAENDTGKKFYLSVVKIENSAFHSMTETEVYTEQVSAEVVKIHRTLNLSKLETGTYRINIKAGKRRFERILDIRPKPAVETETRLIVVQ